jgi:hypothetical protein
MIDTPRSCNFQPRKPSHVSITAPVCIGGSLWSSRAQRVEESRFAIPSHHAKALFPSNQCAGKNALTDPAHHEPESSRWQERTYSCSNVAKRFNARGKISSSLRSPHLAPHGASFCRKAGSVSWVVPQDFNHHTPKLFASHLFSLSAESEETSIRLWRSGTDIQPSLRRRLRLRFFYFSFRM